LAAEQGNLDATMNGPRERGEAKRALRIIHALVAFWDLPRPCDSKRVEHSDRARLFVALSTTSSSCSSLDGVSPPKGHF
jgi:hypothetical protein